MGSVEYMSSELCDICGRWLVRDGTGACICPAQGIHYRFKRFDPPVTPEPTEDELEAGESLE